MSSRTCQRKASIPGLHEVRSLAKEHHEWRGSCINLIASENIASFAVREVLASDFAHRYAEGEPYDRNYRGTRYIDRIETIVVELSKKLFNVEHVNVKPISGCLANLAALYALTKPYETIMTLSVPDGGHISLMEFGSAGVRGLKVEYFPFNREEMNLDVDAAAKKIRAVKPVLSILGGSVILFPPPVREMRKLADEYGGRIMYDASHVLGLIAGRQFQNPVEEGADLVASSTHKTFPGPQGGIILCKKNLGERVDQAVFPGLTSNHHLHRLAGLAVALMEMQEFGVEYAKQTVKNAKALAEGLFNGGFNVLCAEKGFTESHQVVVNVAKQGGGDIVSGLLEKANIICNKNLIPGDKVGMSRNPSGIRLGVAEVTRLGLKESDMEQVSDLIKQTVIDGEDPKKMVEKVKAFIGEFSTVKYSFNKNEEAYRYVDFY